MIVMCPEHCMSKTVQENRIQFKVRPNVVTKPVSVLLFCCFNGDITASTSGLLATFGHFCTRSRPKRLSFATAQKQHSLFSFQPHAAWLQPHIHNITRMRVSCFKLKNILLYQRITTGNGSQVRIRVQVYVLVLYQVLHCAPC